MSQIGTTVPLFIETVVERLREAIDVIDNDSIFVRQGHDIGESPSVDEQMITVSVGRSFQFDLANFVGAGLADLEIIFPFSIAVHDTTVDALEEEGTDNELFRGDFEGDSDLWMLWRLQLAAIGGWIAENANGDQITADAIEPNGGNIEYSPHAQITTEYKATFDIDFTDVTLAIDQSPVVTLPNC